MSMDRRNFLKTAIGAFLGTAMGPAPVTSYDWEGYTSRLSEQLKQIFLQMKRSEYTKHGMVITCDLPASLQAAHTASVSGLKDFYAHFIHERLTLAHSDNEALKQARIAIGAKLPKAPAAFAGRLKELYNSPMLAQQDDYFIKACDGMGQFVHGQLKDILVSKHGLRGEQADEVVADAQRHFWNDASKKLPDDQCKALRHRFSSYSNQPPGPTWNIDDERLALDVHRSMHGMEGRRYFRGSHGRG